MKRLLILSVAFNVGLLALVLWMHRAQRAELLNLIDISMRGDRTHLAIHARSLSALESNDPAQVEETIALLRALESGAERIEELRRDFRQAFDLDG